MAVLSPNGKKITKIISPTGKEVTSITAPDGKLIYVKDTPSYYIISYSYPSGTADLLQIDLKWYSTEVPYPKHIRVYFKETGCECGYCTIITDPPGILTTTFWINCANKERTVIVVDGDSGIEYGRQVILPL